MTPRARKAGLAAAVVVLAAAVSWVLFVALPRWTAPKPTDPAPSAEAPAEASRKIHARLYYVAPSGARLVAVEREVEFAETPTAQARRLVEAQLAPPPDGSLSAIPEGTALRNLYLTGSVAYVDVTGEISRGHTGGSLAEILTVYSLVNVLTENLRAVSSVQILIDGKEVDTLAGHVDLRRPLQGSPQWVDEPGGTTDETPAPTPPSTSG
jgi:spore germination protein GerM